MTVFTVVGYALIGGAITYSLNRWRWPYVVLVGWTGMLLATEPLPTLAEIHASYGGSWWNAVAFVVGCVIGGLLGEEHRRETPNTTTDTSAQARRLG